MASDIETYSSLQCSAFHIINIFYIWRILVYIKINCKNENKKLQTCHPYPFKNIEIQKFMLEEEKMGGI